MATDTLPRKRIVVGMSGGVDSSMSLALLKDAGWEPVGVSLKLASWEDERNCLGENVCCTDESLAIAKSVCEKLGVEYHIYDVSEDFRKQVMDYFVAELKEGRTPNPCMICNRHMKFKNLFKWAAERGIEYVATGHYAKTQLNKQTGEHDLLIPKDTEKDQTYGLAYLPQEWLKRIIFPLGDLTKEEVYEYAKKHGFEIFLKRRQSQDLCFVSHKAIPAFIEEKIGRKEGIVIDESGKEIGRHEGLHFYTIGQKISLGLPERHFVKRSDSKSNNLIATKRRGTITTKEAELSPYSFTHSLAPEKKLEIKAKIRYRTQAADAWLHPPTEGKLKVEFKEPQEAVTPGQFCVFYKGNACLGGGMISSY